MKRSSKNFYLSSENSRDYFASPNRYFKEKSHWVPLLYIFPLLNKNSTEPYLVRHIEAIYIYTDKNRRLIF